MILEVVMVTSLHLAPLCVENSWTTRTFCGAALSFQQLYHLVYFLIQMGLLVGRVPTNLICLGFLKPIHRPTLGTQSMPGVLYVLPSPSLSLPGGTQVAERWASALRGESYQNEIYT